MKEKGLNATNNSVVIAEGEVVRGLKGNGKNTIKVKKHNWRDWGKRIRDYTK